MCFISRIIQKSQLIRETYPNFPKTHKLKNLVLILEDKKTICRNIGVSNVNTFSHADFKGVEFYATRQYVHLSKDGRGEDFFVSGEEEEDNEVMPVSELPLLLEGKMFDVEI